MSLIIIYEIKWNPWKRGRRSSYIKQSLSLSLFSSIIFKWIAPKKFRLIVQQKFSIFPVYERGKGDKGEGERGGREIEQGTERERENSSPICQRIDGCEFSNDHLGRYKLGTLSIKYLLTSSSKCWVWRHVLVTQPSF